MEFRKSVRTVTVLAFFPDTSHNPEPVSRWNALVDQFANRPVQFVWITAEEDATLIPWLKEHSVKGSVLLDPSGETGRAYGMEVPEAVIIGADRTILGFDMEIVPSERTLNAALKGLITTTPPKAEVADFEAFVESGRVLLQAEPRRMQRPGDHRPDFPPSYALHVSPAKGERGSFGGDDFESFQDYDLTELIALLYDVNPIRIQLPASLDGSKRYNFVLVLPQAESRESMYERIRQGVQDYFHVTIAREPRLLDAYVVTVPDAKPPAAKPREEDGGGFSSSSSVGFSVMHGHGAFTEMPKVISLGDIHDIQMEGTMDEFCQLLGTNLDRPVVNESNLEGQFEFHVEGSKEVPSDFLERLHQQLGIVITPAQRNVEMILLKPR